MSNFTIDFFELCFLCEVCLPPSPIARAMFFQDMSDKHYHAMTDSERNRCFKWITEKEPFSLEEEDCQHFFARFNPKNQFIAHTFYDGKKDSIECYRYNGELHTSKSMHIYQDYIVEINSNERTSLEI